METELKSPGIGSFVPHRLGRCWPVQHNNKIRHPGMSHSSRGVSGLYGWHMNGVRKFALKMASQLLAHNPQHAAHITATVADGRGDRSGDGLPSRHGGDAAGA